MTWKDILEIGLKEDAPYRKDNLPDRQVRGPQNPAGPGRSAEIPMSRKDHTEPAAPAPPEVPDGPTEAPSAATTKKQL
ncbi:MAG: hypothetical protein A3F70_02410 [Acidobacteria bacterium RIFCSPLOWO2_12_FULL_67_14]|nr:MAG: hypothetical protein A3H29_16415 [Acidobacteria bacterium RIFCSPLOWO2_02_FULL_67_21]OFW39533.1 MAG: hypothetical protein A3F70_02410 [Acidobacteria bacterium RIFCSPLOWO2_12_FULL_67_14]